MVFCYRNLRLRTFTPTLSFIQQIVHSNNFFQLSTKHDYRNERWLEFMSNHDVPGTYGVLSQIFGLVVTQTLWFSHVISEVTETEREVARFPAALLESRLQALEHIFKTYAWNTYAIYPVKWCRFNSWGVYMIYPTWNKLKPLISQLPFSFLPPMLFSLQLCIRCLNFINKYSQACPLAQIPPIEIWRTSHFQPL